ncbi:reverse transcriptase [Phytophthora megakarya]|uniref:Reverse transcriptase n=1 Tax=Phytophthora megakarya TaxID=4795 RepID=A0A225UQY7_9STRA|nr:reverse transcriptase [Phytophthora megakarya]
MQNSRSVLLTASNNEIRRHKDPQRPPHNMPRTYHHDSGDLSAEDLKGNLAVLPEIPISTSAKVSIEDLQVGDSGSATPEEIERLGK